MRKKSSPRALDIEAFKQAAVLKLSRSNQRLEITGSWIATERAENHARKATHSVLQKPGDDEPGVVDASGLSGSQDGLSSFNVPLVNTYRHFHHTRFSSPSFY
jgi:hypothetical protein